LQQFLIVPYRTGFSQGYRIRPDNPGLEDARMQKEKGTFARFKKIADVDSWREEVLSHNVALISFRSRAQFRLQDFSDSETKSA